MLKTTLIIKSPEDEQIVELNDKLSIGRTPLADLTINDSSLSRLHATFEIINDEIWVFDENSMNGTFLNGERISSNGVRLRDGDTVYLGNQTLVTLKLQNPKSKVQSQFNQNDKTQSGESKSKEQRAKPETNKIPPVIIFAGILTTVIVGFSLAILLIVNAVDNSNGSNRNRDGGSAQSPDIPVNLIDPLKGEPQDLEELFAAWEVQENPLEATDVEAVSTSAEAPDLVVTVADWEKQRAKALEARGAAIGKVDVNVPPELAGRGIPKQIAKIQELGLSNQLPQDFAALAEMRVRRELIEVPLATQDYVLDVGGSATDAPFTSFNFDTREKTELAPGSGEYNILAQLAANFGGQKYDLNNSRDRKQMRQRLLRMFRPAAKPILEEIAKSYSQKFNRPLRITSLTRSLEYQVDLAKVNSNAFRGATPPHTTGCAFDLAWLQMTADEQNFLMAKIAEFERAGKIDALREVGVAPCFHIFVYPDNRPPKGF
jgi:pSer/pThr/pTyr-binding forkhead associated (FHA) protein